MSKITFRADDDLVERVERLDASKSEVMREALRAYLDEREPSGRAPRGREEAGAPGAGATTLDALLAERIDALLAERLEGVDAGGQDLNLSISLEGAGEGAADAGGHDRARGAERRKTPASDAPPAEPDAEAARECGQCGTALSSDHVYCPNCGEKASRRLFCDCGDEIRSDWGFCPSCGRRTPAADVLDNG